MKKLRFLAILSLLAISVSSCTLLYPNWGKPTDRPSPSDTNSPSPSETDTEKPSPTPSDKGEAVVEIQDAYVDSQFGVLQVVAQITNFSEDGGKCTATFNGGGKTVSVTGNAESNAANTQCRPIEISLVGLPKGSGVVTVSYDSATKHGVSSSTAVTIP